MIRFTHAAVVATSALVILSAFQEEEPPERSDDLAAFHYEPGQLHVGRVLHYRHSNVDGTHGSRVSLYLAGEESLEALKWNPGWDRATLVEAEMDWESFSVRRFRTSVITTGGERQHLGELEALDGGRELVAHFGGREMRCAIAHLPWHSYDFDLASLNVSMRYLIDPEGIVTLGIADARSAAGGPVLAFQGLVELRYEGDEERLDIPCRRYSLDGPGLEDRGGLVWASRDDERHFVDFEIDLADEPGYTSGKLSLLEKGELNAGEWEDFVRTSVR